MIIQVVSQYFAPDNFRINDIVREMVLHGHDTYVLTGLPDYTTGDIPSKYRFFKLYNEFLFGAQIKRVWILARRKGIVRRALNYGTFLITSSLYALLSKKNFCDAIFVYQPSPVFQIFPAVIFKKRTHKKLIIYCCDIWPEALKSWGIREKSFIYKFIKLFSSWLYKQGDTVAITSKPFRDYLINICGVDNSKIVYLPQHCEDDYADIVGIYDDNNCIDFLFAGNIGIAQNVDVILNAVKLIQSNTPYMVHIVGDGSELDNCKLLSNVLGVQDKVIFHGRHPLSEMKAFYKMADCFLLTLRNDNFIGMTLPAKVQGYLCAGKPIVAAIDGAGHQVINDADCGEAVPSGDVQAFASKMVSIIENFEVYKEKGCNGRLYYERNYTKEKFMDNLLNILKENN